MKGSWRGRVLGERTFVFSPKSGHKSIWRHPSCGRPWARWQQGQPSPPQSPRSPSPSLSMLRRVVACPQAWAQRGASCVTRWLPLGRPVPRRVNVGTVGHSRCLTVLGNDTWHPDNTVFISIHQLRQGLEGRVSCLPGIVRIFGIFERHLNFWIGVFRSKYQCA